MSEVFNIYEKYFDMNIEQAQKINQRCKLKRQLQMKDVNQFDEAINDATNELKKMELDNNMNKSMYEFVNNKKKIEQAKMLIKMCRNQFFNYKSKSIKSENYNGQSLFSNFEQINFTLLEKKQNIDLKQALKQMHKNEYYSNQICLQLKNNNDKIEQISQKVTNIDGQLIKGIKLLRSIQIKSKRNKFILYGTILMIITIVSSLILYNFL